jgi:hypothetical protein
LLYSHAVGLLSIVWSCVGVCQGWAMAGEWALAGQHHACSDWDLDDAKSSEELKAYNS